MFDIKLKVMKNSLYIIAGLLIVIWIIYFWSFKSFGIVHMLIVLAGFIILFRIILNKKLSSK
jgi:predicted ferric reductase